MLSIVFMTNKRAEENYKQLLLDWFNLSLARKYMDFTF